MTSWWLSLLLVSGLTLAASKPAATEPGRPPVPFDAAMYAQFVMPFPEVSRVYQTSTPGQAAAFLKVRLRVHTPPDLKLLGVWTTRDATYDPFDIYGPDRAVPGALFLFTRDLPGPSAASTDTAALAISVQRPNLSAAAYQKARAGQARIAVTGEYRQRPLDQYVLYSRCWSGGGGDYPALGAQVHSTCVAEVRSPKTTLRVMAVNLSERRAIAEVTRLSSLLE